MFKSPRQAIGYMYTCFKQGQMRRPKWHEKLDPTHMDESTHHVIAAFVYGPKVKGCCGVHQGSTLDQQLQRWATLEPACNYYNRAVRAVERRVFKLLREHDLKLQAKIRTQRVLFVDTEGEPHDHVGEKKLTAAG